MRHPAPSTRTLVLLEGDSDAGAVRALASLVGCDLARRGIVLHAAHGVTNFSRDLCQLLFANPGATFCSLYDAADEWHVRRALAGAGIERSADVPLESLGFFACRADLEDELIGAVGAEGVQRVIEAQGELASFRRFQAKPQHRDTPVRRQLRRFLGTRATRKIRMAPLLVEALAPDRLPAPLAGLAARMLETPHA